MQGQHNAYSDWSCADSCLCISSYLQTGGLKTTRGQRKKAISGASGNADNANQAAMRECRRSNAFCPQRSASALHTRPVRYACVSDLSNDVHSVKKHIAVATHVSLPNSHLFGLSIDGPVAANRACTPRKKSVGGAKDTQHPHTSKQDGIKNMLRALDCMRFLRIFAR